MEKIKFFDGGMGTMLQSHGLKAGELPELLNLTMPETVYAIHQAYADAGSDYISTNTFGANGLKFDNVSEIVHAAISLVKRTGKKVVLDIGPLGKLLKPMGTLSFEDAYELYKEIIVSGKDDADIILFETMTDLLEIKAAVLAAKENCNLPIFVSMMFDESGRLLTGANIQTAVATLEGLGIDVIGMNCGLGPKEMLTHAKEMRKYTSLPMIVNPNAGLPESINGKTVYNVSPEQFAEYMSNIADLGVSYLGGCCGTTPEYIESLINKCKNIPASAPKTKKRTVVTSYSKAVEIGKDFVVIGERINPTGKKLFKEALRRNDIGYIVKEGIAQKECGAEILDVNVGLPEIDEPKMMKDAVYALQSVLDLPLQIDTSNTVAMENALRLYNGKAMLNSVNGKFESMEAVFPLVKKYGAVVVCLCLDESGIPDDVDGRILIAEKIIKTAEKYGIDKSDLVFDALALTISTGGNNAITTLETIKRLRNELDVSSILGVSNISFGLPCRDEINTAFFNMAMNAGLSCGILNPLSKPMMNTYYSFRALKGLDANCEQYIKSVSESTLAPVKSVETLDLKAAIVKGLADDAAKCAKKLLESSDSMNIINEYIIPALNTVGDGFENKKIFLPQLLLSADSAKAAFDIIKESLILSGTQKSGDKIVLATVHGDIHDIGKNIVRVLLENYGFDVLDLGKDVPESDVLEAVKATGATLVGLSALMTTTVPAMQRTIQLIHDNTNAKVVVGGAVLTESYAKMIQADFYAKDAMQTVRTAEHFFNT